MAKNNKKNKARGSRGPPKNNVNAQVSRRINLFGEKITRLVSLTCQIYIGSTGQYSFLSAADQRYFNWLDILASADFTNAALVYDQYRVVSASMAICPCITVLPTTTFRGMLYVTVSPGDTSSTNPTAGTVVNGDRTRLISPTSTIVDVVTWKFAGVGPSTHLWNDVNSISSLGLFAIGNQVNLSMGATTAYPIFDGKFDLVVEFTKPK